MSDSWSIRVPVHETEQKKWITTYKSEGISIGARVAKLVREDVKKLEADYEKDN